jgi:hypothetical protein
MHPEKFQFLNLKHLPGRFTVQETAWYMGFSEDDVPQLTKAKLLKTTGRPSEKATKFYAYADLCRLHDTTPWMHKASDTMYRHWQSKHRKHKRKPKRKP